MTVYEYLDKRKRLFELYDNLLPEFAARAMRSTPAAHRQAAEFVALFSQLMEPPLIPYYQAVGKEFFDWVRRLGN
jgi:hypothetical protein